ncbi:MAG: FkbM family methyltransferase [Acidobacteria bacterium]|nr:MAG: FkbM family methyltransferase [Acidobacteriota bacterium]
MLRAQISRLLPVTLKKRLRPLAVPLLYRLEQPRMSRFYAQFVDRGDLVFDIGAAEGYHSEVFLALGANVVALEPQPYCLGVLQRRFAGRANVKVLAKGVSDADGELGFSICEGDPEISTFAVAKWRSGRYAGRRWEPEVRIPVVTLDSLVAIHGRPEFVKIDVEGFEERVLRGLSSPLPALSFEFNREFIADVDACVEHVCALGPAHFNFSLYRRYALHSPTWLDRDELLTTLDNLPGENMNGDIYVRSGG